MPCLLVAWTSLVAIVRNDSFFAVHSRVHENALALLVNARQLGGGFYEQSSRLFMWPERCHNQHNIPATA